jgi:hypothetical protein
MGRQFSPFANESDALGIGGLEIENRLDRVSFHGDVDVTLDREGLEKVLALKAVVDAVAEALSGRDLPDRIRVAAPKKVKNPFE